MISYKNTTNEIKDSGIRTAIIPVGSIEQHASHLPVGTDYLIAQKMAEALAERIKSTTVEIKMEHGQDGRLYGSVTTKDIAEALSKQYGITVDKRKIVMPDPIKAYGTYNFDVRLYPEIVGKVRVTVGA